MRIHRSSNKLSSAASFNRDSAEATPLQKWPKGLIGRVLRLEGDEDFKNRLREMGLCESAEVSVLQVNGSVLCQVQGSRFGLSRSAAEAVLIGGLA